MVSRRSFLGGATLGLAGGMPRLWLNTAAAAESSTNDRILVVLDLDGGNDGLNTVVPYANDIYHRNRPTLAITAENALKLDDHLGLHPAMKDLHELWKKGQCRIIQNVGYPEPNRSHFRSREIWHSGRAPDPVPVGWLGRVSDGHPKIGACQIGDDVLPLILRGRQTQGRSVADLANYRLEPEARLASTSDQQEDAILAEIQNRIEATGRFLKRASRAAAEVAAVDHSVDDLAGRLATVRAMMRHEPGLRLFYVRRGGFDTHSRQRFRHQSLLNDVSREVSRFVGSLRDDGLQQRVLVLVISEFGRRLRENGQLGTDHGAAAPIFLVGQPVKGGLHGAPPDLEDLDSSGDVRHQIDFRDVYASLLKQWLDVDPTPILGRRNSALALLAG